MTKTQPTTLAALGLLLSTGAAPAASPCLEAQSRVDEATALRHRARQELRLGNRDRVCDILDEAGDRYGDARDAFEDCAAGAIAIDLRGELRSLRLAKQINGCD